MRKYDLLRSGDSIVRVLEIEKDKVLILDCIKQKMPAWVERSTLDSYEECSVDTLLSVTGLNLLDVNLLDGTQRKVMYQRYTMIAPILPFLSDKDCHLHLFLWQFFFSSLFEEPHRMYHS